MVGIRNTHRIVLDKPEGKGQLEITKAQMG
jgi:hypothetical protein